MHPQTTVRSSIAAIAAVALLTGQEVETRLGSASGVIEEPFSDVVGLAELPDGRVIVADRILQEFSLADFRTRQRTVIGRNGTGPNEYLSAFSVIRWRGDTILGYDALGRRLVRFTRSGEIAGSIPMALPGEFGGIGPPRAADTDGNLYWDTPRMDRVAIKRLMTGSIIRWKPGQPSPAVAAEYTDHTEDQHHLRYRAWPSTDAWTVAPDGRIAVLSATEYRLRWVREGKVVDSGPPIPFAAIPVDAAERLAFREQKALEPSSGANMSAGGRAAGPARMSPERVAAAWPDSLFPRTMPPFEPHAMLRAPNGDLWVRRTGRASENVRRVDVLDPAGRRRTTVRLPDRTRLVGIGAGGIYLVRVDDDGLQTLERYAWPTAAR